MKVSNAARLIFWVTAIFAIGILVRAESGEKRVNAPNRKSAPPLRIVDQNGRPAVSGVPSGGQIFDVAVGQGGDVFVPDTVNISVGDTVRWTWAEGGHSVTSGDPCTADGQFCSPNNTNCGHCVTSNQGFVYEFTFTGWQFLLLLLRPLRCRYDWSGQCFSRWRLQLGSRGASADSW